MGTPETRFEFERRFHLLREKMQRGQIHFSAHLHRAIDGIARIRYLPNGRIDFLSVDESARLQANMMSQWDNESLRDMMTKAESETE